MQKELKRIVVKIGSNSLTHPATGRLDYIKIERLAKELSNLRNRGLDVCLVSSGAIAVGRQSLGVEKPTELSRRQALASVGQVRLMSIYQRSFAEFNQMTGQILLTKNAFLDNVSRKNAENTFEELFSLGVIPIVNANDTVYTYDMQFGDNDTLSALVAALVGADLLVLLSDIDGLYTADPRENASATLIPKVEQITSEILAMGSDHPGSSVGSGGMKTKLTAAQIATSADCGMIIANAKDVHVLNDIYEDHYIGTYFAPDPSESFDLVDFMERELI